MEKSCPLLSAGLCLKWYEMVVFSLPWVKLTLWVSYFLSPVGFIYLVLFLFFFFSSPGFPRSEEPSTGHSDPGGYLLWPEVIHPPSRSGSVGGDGWYRNPHLLCFTLCETITVTTGRQPVIGVLCIPPLLGPQLHSLELEMDILGWWPTGPIWTTTGFFCLFFCFFAF